MPNAFFYSNTAIQTTLSGSISAGATSMTVGATTGFPGSFPYILAVDYGAATEELVKVTAAAGTALTVERGFGSTSAQSHSLGAVVRHVVNSVDLTDFRTHEAATADVHGVTGALVGATSTQTLTNKTLTNPTVNGGALSGTFTGSPTLSGNLTLSGNPTFSGAPLFTGGPTFSTSAPLFLKTVGTDVALRTTVSGDSNNRLAIRADGQLLWSSGSGTADTNLYRDAANELKTDDALAIVGELKPANLVRGTRAAASDSQYESRVSGDANARWFARADGQMWWGPGSAIQDTNLYRSAADTLKTDDNFIANGNLTVGGAAAITGKVSAANLRTGQATTPAPGGTPGQTSVAVTFSSAMPSVPNVIVTASSASADLNNSNIRWAVQSETTTGFQINCWRDTNSTTTFNWFAVIE
ncbi:H-type lectin domain-containing protein [Streptomyces himalayensis]|uniref:H-type lectin domain-containing protein n=1 Tax=Streptomyces himalayensis subsp. himalayensis TaxID=2756131 RepID=A0A7W0DUC2_9ACTN|nr:H-type lectin domain-containing protein [Streptomyces himalayensis]MBA2951443.1 H-type lectin domain-containing protein [Streptomyces himalayensis subsp. himalayensis]